MTLINKLQNLKFEVEQILDMFPETRNNDQHLTMKLWVQKFPKAIEILPDGTQAVRLVDIMLLPREDNVKRVRAIIQNEEHRYLPTLQSVRKKRQIAESVWLEFIKNPNNIVKI